MTNCDIRISRRPNLLLSFSRSPVTQKGARTVFGDVVRTYVRFNHVFAALDGEELIGVAVWRPPNAALTGLSAQLSGLIMRCRLLALSPRVWKRLLQGFAKLEATQPHIPHWYLFFIGIDSHWRGQCIGARLMAPVLQAADAGEMPCYLETPFPQTLPFYRKLRYEVINEPRPFTGAPQLWAMKREPMPPAE